MVEIGSDTIADIIEYLEEDVIFHSAAIATHVLPEASRKLAVDLVEIGAAGVVLVDQLFGNAAQSRVEPVLIGGQGIYRFPCDRAIAQ